ncbi:hypothetical protein [Acidisoma sp. 7E03]
MIVKMSPLKAQSLAKAAVKKLAEEYQSWLSLYPRGGSHEVHSRATYDRYRKNLDQLENIILAGLVAAQDTSGVAEIFLELEDVRLLATYGGLSIEKTTLHY